MYHSFATPTTLIYLDRSPRHLFREPAVRQGGWIHMHRSICDGLLSVHAGVGHRQDSQTDSYDQTGYWQYSVFVVCFDIFRFLFRELNLPRLF